MKRAVRRKSSQRRLLLGSSQMFLSKVEARKAKSRLRNLKKKRNRKTAKMKEQTMRAREKSL